MIPKKIHYCWFGGTPLPLLAQKCIASWRACMPDYEIIQWNENNYDIGKNRYMKQAYELQKWGFVPDYARLDIIYNMGGIYFDTDVELIKPLSFLHDFDGYIGFESEKYVNLGVGFAAAPRHLVIGEMLKQYDHMVFIRDGKMNLTPSPVYQTAFLLEHGLRKDNTRQNIGGIEIFPARFFSPLNTENFKLNITPETYSIHHFAASWTPLSFRLLQKLKQMLGPQLYSTVKNIALRILPQKMGRRLSGEGGGDE